MYSLFRQKPISFQLKKLSAAVALALMFSNAGAAGWGDLTVLSSLGQPLRAEIELLSASSQGDGPLTVRLAASDAYRQANIEFNPALMSLRFTVEQRGEQQFVRITSTQPLNEPFIDMLLELSSNSGRVVREYVFLLDPAGLNGSQMEVVAPVHRDAVAAPSARTPVEKPAKPAANLVRKPAPVQVPARPDPAPTPATKPATAAPAKPRLSLSGVTATSATDDKAGVIVLEDYATMEKSVAEANARVKALEQKVADLHKLIEVTNNLLAELQKQNELAKAGAKPAAPADAAPVQRATPANAEAKPAEAVPAVTPAPSPAPAPAEKPVAAPAPLKPSAAPPPAESDSNMYVLPGAAFLVTLLGAAGIYFNRRRKAKETTGARLHADAGGDKTTQLTATADTMTTALATGMLLPTGLGQNHEVDPLAEADVYIAYGRDVQAEEILKEALRKQPDRHPVRVKLLSIYAGRKDVTGFDEFARALHGMTGGEGDEWKQAAELGREIDPGNPLYAAPRMQDASEPANAVHGLVLERIVEEEPAATASSPNEADGPELRDMPLPDLAPPIPAVIDEARESGPGPIDFDFLKPEASAVATQDHARKQNAQSDS